MGLTAITLAYPASALVGAIGTGLGLSGAIRFTILNAQGEPKKRQECFSGTTLLMLIVAGLLTALLFGFTEPILHLLGARADMLGLCAEYARIIAQGAVFQILATGFVPFIRNMGGATITMIAMDLGFVTNIVLDYTFVWVLNQGMAGAAWATIIGQAVTMVVAVIFFLVKKSSLRLPEFRELCSLWKDVLKVSLSPFGLTFSPTITLLLMNRFLLLYKQLSKDHIFDCLPIFNRHIFPSRLHSDIRRANDLSGVLQLLKAVGAPAGNACHCKDRRKQLTWQIQHPIYKSRIEIHIGADPLVHFPLLRYDLRRKPCHQRIKGILILIPLFCGKGRRTVHQKPCSGVGLGVNSMSDPVNKPRSVKSLPV